MNDQYVLGVHFGHNASMALARNGLIVAALAEERLRRIKNYTGFPAQAIRWAVDTYLAGDAGRIDRAVIPMATNIDYHFYTHQDRFADGRYFGCYHETEKNEIPDFFRYPDEAAAREYIARDQAHVARLNADADLTRRMRGFFRQELGVNADRLTFLDHHAAHAESACLSLPPGREWLVFTLDASGDNVCATVSRYDGQTRTELARVPRYAALGTFYREVTAFLGMKPDEHEFKVMGLAPYAKEHDVRRVFRKFAPLVGVNACGEFESAFPLEWMKYYLLRECVYDRFDSVAGAAQLLLETRVTEWVRHWIAQSGIRRIALAGGVFLNVKLNQRLSQCDEVEEVYIVPSAGDESLVFGCCRHGAAALGQTARPLRELYLGPEYTPADVERALAACPERGDWEIRRESDIDACVAGLLARGEVVARFAGRAEFGARALGNRSLLADPRNRETVRVINEMIKGRDFWMPFTPSILAEDLDQYVRNPRQVFAPYMIICFDSTPAGQAHLPAAMHPYDFTLRPQAVLEDWNPRYHRLLREFKRLTGVGGVLNTSLNLHGEPLVQAPADALHVLRHSGLRRLALEDWLITKKQPDASAP